MQRENVFRTAKGKMSEQSNQVVETLRTAKNLLLEEAETGKKCVSLQNEVRQLQQTANQAGKEMEAEVEKSLRFEQQKIEKKLKDAQTQIGSEQKKTAGEKKKAKKRAIDARIKEETAGLVFENKGIREQLKESFKKDGLPRCLSSGMLFSIFFPRRILDYAKILFSFLVIAGGVPAVIWLALPDRKIWIFVILVAVFALLYGLVYFLVQRKIRATDPKRITDAKNRNIEIHANQEKIREISKAIRTDLDESRYDLGEFDSRLAESGNRLAAAKEEYDAEMKVYEEQTKGALEADIRAKYQETIAMTQEEEKEKTAQLDAAKALREKLNAEINGTYVPLIGKHYMREKSLDTMIGLAASKELDSMEAVLAAMKNPSADSAGKKDE